MALYNVTTVNNTLLSTANTANCESEIINQDAGDTDFESIRDTRVHWRLNNISSGLSSADLLVSTVPIQNGDRIFIRKDDNSIYDTTAQGVVQNTAPIHPNMTSNNAPEGVALSSPADTDAFKAFDGDDGTYTTMKLDVGSWIQYQFKNNTPTSVSSFYFRTHTTNAYQHYHYIAFNIEGSLDGDNWSTISTHPTLAYYEDGEIFQIESPGSYSYYRLICTDVGNSADTYHNYVVSFSLLSESGNTVDTSGITLGETPTHVFKFTDTIKFNGGDPATQKDVFYEYGTTGTKLAVISVYNDYVLNGTTLKTTFEFTSSGNEVVETTGQIYKLI